jgi:tetratricopeptide (TPR) repeat protein
MSAALEEKDRHIFPRWRSFNSTAVLGELHSAQLVARNDLAAVDVLLDEEIAQLKSTPSLWHTLDALGTAIVAARAEAVSDLKQLAIADANAPTFAVSYLTRSETNLQRLTPDIAISIGEKGAREDISAVRHRLEFNPRDAIEWVELARAYTILGVNEKAKRAVQVALQLAPENRFILRSAARFFIHIGETDRAHHILARSERLRLDPWLLASEVAIADSIGKTSRNVKIARQHLSSDTAPTELSELASALGTLESQGGNARIARKLLRQSFVGANENSIAQINWVQRKHLGEEIDTSDASPPLLHEANAWLNYYKAEWELAKRESLFWLQDQPFASAPALLSSYLLSDVLGEFETAENILTAAVIANPDEAMLRNNLAFSQLNLNKVGLAERSLGLIKPDELLKPQNRLIQATFGMLEFRRGNPHLGRELYWKCIDEGEPYDAARAAAHLLLEEIVANTDQIANALATMRRYEAEAAAPEINCILKRAQALLAEPIIDPRY